MPVEWVVQRETGYAGGVGHLLPYSAENMYMQMAHVLEIIILL